jgi:hypothetical protein
MSVEQLLFIALFVLVPLFNFLAKVLRQRRRPAAPIPQAEEPGEPVTALPPPRVLLPVPEPPRPSARPPRAPAVLVVERRRRAPYRLRPADVRRGLVLMTILGPCRALEREASPNTYL